MILPLLLAGFLLQTLQVPAVVGSGTIEGVVVRAGTSPPSPLVNARLELSGRGNTWVARTNFEGQFLFQNLPAGTFSLKIAKDGYVRQEYGQAGIDGPGRPIVLSEGQSEKAIVFNLEPAPTVSGRVFDVGSPVSGIEVHALRRVYDRRGNRAFSLTASTVTDDHGGYRLYWLDPGEYFVVAVVPAQSSAPATASATASVTARAPTFFPATADPDGAKAVWLTFGRDAHGIDIQLANERLGSFFGYVNSMSLGPVVANVAIEPAPDGSTVGRYSGSSSSQGPYSIGGIAPGSYVISARLGEESGAVRVRMNRAGLRVNLDIGPGMNIQGLVFNAAGLPMDLSSFRIHLNEVDPALPDPPLAAVDSSLRFDIHAVQPGLFTLGVTGLSGDLYLKSATYKGADVLAKPLSVAYGGQNSTEDLQVQIGTDGAQLRGRVSWGDAPIGNAQVILMPETESRFRFDLYRSAVTKEDGSFTLDGIAPGAYKVFAWQELEANAHLNVDFVLPYENMGTSIQLAPSQRASIGLTAIRP